MVKTLNASSLTCSLKGIISSLITVVILFPLCAWTLTLLSDPRTLISVLPKVISVLSALIGGFVCGRCGSDKAVLSALICGTALYAATVTVCLILGGSLLSVPVGLVCTVIPSVLGALIGIPKEKSAGAKRRALIKKLGR